MKNLLLSAAFGAFALGAGFLCHRMAPGLGLVLMPMFWPLSILAAKVPAKYSVATAVLVPVVSFALTGMPSVPVVVALKFALFTGVAAILFRRVFARMRR